jgi:hypothetical protein
MDIVQATLAEHGKTLLANIYYVIVVRQRLSTDTRHEIEFRMQQRTAFALAAGIKVGTALRCQFKGSRKGRRIASRTDCVGGSLGSGMCRSKWLARLAESARTSNILLKDIVCD